MVSADPNHLLVHSDVLAIPLKYEDALAGLTKSEEFSVCLRMDSADLSR